MFRLRGTVILNIWLQIFMIAVYTGAIVCIHKYVDGLTMNLPQTFPVLGVVTGLLLVFRTNTAYDRYWEGRKIWSTMTLAIRDLKELIGHIPHFSNQSLNQPLDTKGTFIGETMLTTNIPIELSYYIASYIKSVKDRDIIDPSSLTLMNNALTTLVECVTGLERILRTPIPLAYSVHLHQAVWLYLLSLPYQMVGVLDWFTIPAVTLASFALLRILELIDHPVEEVRTIMAMTAARVSGMGFHDSLKCVIINESGSSSAADEETDTMLKK
ncbi:hypothetical protein Fcan01_08795 [Folsomia candida]|uniref:Uncharacterized protein n=1 Tax=Folsomia candida TaxID=158441 RepID=A0A226EFJ2_FOLCA|nr:hypothetical protein Fcan01_08795 [Folsomia candida]